jgi:peptidoglycan hydrolase CwlO-like protein
MTEAIIVAVIALAGQIVIALISNSGIVAKLDKQSEVNDTKLHGELDVIKSDVSTLRKEVEKHNSVIERTYRIEERITVAEEKIKVANNRINDLERKAG